MARQPNILLIMADQMSATAMPFSGGPAVAPNIERLADEGVAFEAAYCNSPLCAPSRFSMLSGQLPSRIGGYDNAAEFPATVPTLAHYLRAGGYRTCLSGKMHFVGPDQLHGYEERVTTDIYPADFGWTPNWDEPETRYQWFHNMLSVVEAGVYERSIQLDFDDDVGYQAVRKIYDFARDTDDRPFFLTASFTQPHDPYFAPRQYWDRYDHDAVAPPTVGMIPPDERDPHSRRLYYLYGMDQYDLTAAHVRNARHAYLAMISYIDDRVGELLRALEVTGLRQDTIVILTADHGDMLGERGMWYKMSFFEPSIRVPLIIQAPGRFAARRVSQGVSLLDLLPTLVDFAADGQRASEPAVSLDGTSLAPLLHGDDEVDSTVVGEYLAEATPDPIFMVRRWPYKYVAGASDPPQLFDLSADPEELTNLADQPDHAETVSAFAAEVADRWDQASIHDQVLASQRARRLTYESLRKGQPTHWDYEPRWDVSRQYTRNHESMDDSDRRARIPRREPPLPDHS